MGGWNVNQVVGAEHSTVALAILLKKAELRKRVVVVDGITFPVLLSVKERNSCMRRWRGSERDSEKKKTHKVKQENRMSNCLM